MLRRVVLFAFCAAFVLSTTTKNAWAQKPAEEQLKLVKLNDQEFEVSLFASEPMITNPTAIDVDTQGRVWVSEIQFYRSRAKSPPADKIKVLEDTKGSGRADKMTVFAEGVFCPMSVCVAGEKVYVATSPDLWAYEDKNGDLKADGPPTKLLSGFGGRNHDHGAHSLVLGPDHKWWMSHGDTGFKVTGTDGSKIEFRWGAMLRGELDGSKLETVAVNFRNPYEICVSSFGVPYCSDNDNDGNQSVRICWIMEGGNYGWYGGPPFDRNSLDKKAPPGTPFREAWHFRGHIPGNVPGTIVTGFGSPCGVCFYEGDAFGTGVKNMPWHCDAGPAEVRAYPHERAGFGMKGSQKVLMACGDKYFRPVDVCAAPDGSIYVADWYDGGVGGHAYNNPDQGRIFKLTPKGKKLHRREKPGPYSNIADAIEGLKSPNLATQFLARERLLAEGIKSIPALTDLLKDADQNFAARALWVLDRIGGEGRQGVIAQLKNEKDSFRALAVRILRRHGDQYAAEILARADDPSPEVVCEVLLAIRAIQSEAAESTLAKIAARYDGADRYMLEAIHIACGDRKMKLYEALVKLDKIGLKQFDLLQLLNPQAASQLLIAKLATEEADEHTAEKLLVMAGTIDAPEAGKSLLQFATKESAPAKLRKLALISLGGKLSGSWRTIAQDNASLSQFQKLLADKTLQGTMLTIAGEQGLKKLGGEIADLSKNDQTPPETRVQAIKTLTKLKADGTAENLRLLLKDTSPGVREEAALALVDLQDAKAMASILSTDQFEMATRKRAAERMMESTGGALVLLKAIDAKSLPDELQKNVLAKATRHVDANVRVLFEKFIPEKDRPKRLGEEIKAEQILAMSGDAARGESIFFKSNAAQCKNCHAANGKGLNVGPDLSTIGTKYAREVLLESILDPSKAIAPEFIVHLVETKQGQVYAGFLVEKSGQQMLIKDAKNELIRFPLGDVEQVAPQKKSMMPELVLRDVSAQDAADLLAYLQTLTKENQEKKKGK